MTALPQPRDKARSQAVHPMPGSTDSVTHLEDAEDEETQKQSEWQTSLNYQTYPEFTPASLEEWLHQGVSKGVLTRTSKKMARMDLERSVKPASVNYYFVIVKQSWPWPDLDKDDAYIHMALHASPLDNAPSILTNGLHESTKPERMLTLNKIKQAGVYVTEHVDTVMWYAKAKANAFGCTNTHTASHIMHADGLFISGLYLVKFK